MSGDTHAGGEPSFVGREAELSAGLELAAGRPGLLVVVGATWVGTSRFAAELAGRLEADGAVRIRLRGGGTVQDRLASGLTTAGLRPDPASASRLRPFAALIDDVDDAIESAWSIGAGLAGTGGLLIGCVHEIPVGPAFVELPPLGDDDARAIVLDVSPGLDETTTERVLALGAGRPGVLVPLARANRRGMPEERPLRVPPALTRAALHEQDAVGPEAIDVARWAAVLGEAFEAADLVPLTGRALEGLAPALDALVLSGLLDEVPDPGPVTLRFRDPLAADALRQDIPPSDLRRRHGAVLRFRRGRGGAAPALVAHAVGSGDPREVVDVSLRAARVARERGEGGEALAHADRALAWCDREHRDSDRLEAVLERGLALAVLGRWGEAAETLGDTIRRQRRAGNEAAAVRAATEWARVQWYAGYLDEAFELVAAHVPEGDAPLAERAQALTQAAMFAAMAGRHSDAHGWAERALAEAVACGDRLTEILALNALGLSEVRSTASPDGLERLREGLALSRSAGIPRQTAVTLNNESVCLLMLGMVRQAADRAQEGLDLVESHSIAELDAPLSHNLAEALSAMGRLRDARRLALRSRSAFERLGSRSLEPLDALLAWVDFQEGKVAEALDALRAMWNDAKDNLTIEHIGSVAAFHIHAALAAGNDGEAREIARAAVDAWRGTEDRLDSLGLLGAAAAVLPASEAKPVVAELEAAVAAGAPIAAALAPFARAHSAPKSSAAAAFRDAAATFAAAGMDWWSARALLLAGEAGARNQAAIDDLLEARRLFRDAEAPGWRARCEAELRARGHRFVMASRRRESVLSDRELEVLQCLALGLTNREIAERLYISEKTAGRHLENVYAKLGVTSRTAAVSAGVERGMVTEPLDQAPSYSAPDALRLEKNPDAPTTA